MRSIMDFFDETRRRTIACVSATELQRSLRCLPSSYRNSAASSEKIAGYLVGESRLTEIRNAAALAGIRRDPDFRERVLEQIARCIAEASVFLRSSNARLGDTEFESPSGGGFLVERRRIVSGAGSRVGFANDEGSQSASAHNQIENENENEFARIPARRWADTIGPGQGQ